MTDAKKSQPLEDQVLARMLAKPPETHIQPKAKKKPPAKAPRKK